MAPVAVVRSPAFPLSWRGELDGGATTAFVTVEGELDRRTAPALRDHLEWWLAAGCTRLVVDTSGVTFADVGAHDLLRALGRRATERACTIALIAPAAAVRRLLDLLGAPSGVTVEAATSATPAPPPVP